MEVPSWIARLPFGIRVAFGVLATLVTSQADKVWAALGPLGDALAIALAAWVIVGSSWHFINEWRTKNGKPKLQFDPIYIVAAGLVLAGIGMALTGLRRPTALDAELSSKIERLQASLDKFVKPRELTDEQIKAIAEFLLPRSHHTIRIYFAPTNEANSFAGQIHQGFKGGDWDIPVRGIEPIAARADLSDSEGLHVYAASSPGEKTPPIKAYDLASEALAKAGITHNGSGNITSQNGEHVIIVVGRRPTR